MEQFTLLIILGNALLLAVLALGWLLYSVWRRKTHSEAALERLFEDVKDRQLLRKEQMMASFIGPYKLTRPLAEELVSTLFEMEKQFLTQFVEAQMQQRAEESFYHDLSELLDGYLHAVPKKLLPDAGSEPPKAKRVTESETTPPSREEKQDIDWDEIFG